MTTHTAPLHTAKIRNQSYVKHYNIQTVLRVLEECQPVSRTEIVRLTEMSPTSITRIINALMRLGLICETDSVPKSSRGRKAINLCVRQDAIYTLGAFLTYDRLRMCLMDYGGRVLYTDFTELEARHYEPREIALLCLRMYERIPRELVSDWLHVCALGISCGGIIDPERGIVVRSDHMNWENAELVSALKAELGIPVWLENDVKACLIGEKARQGLADSIDTAYLMVGTGVGLAATVSGRVMRGFNCCAGEIERLPLTLDPEHPTTLHDELREAALLMRARAFEPDITDISALFSKLDRAWAREILADFKRYLTFTLNMIDAICDPHTIILGGTLIPVIAPYITDIVPQHHVIIGKNYEEACSIGAAIVARRGAVQALISEQIEL